MNLRRLMLLVIFATQQLLVQADAGFNIRRKQATVRVQFRNLEQLGNYQLVHYRWLSEAPDQPLRFAVLDTLSNESIISLNNAHRFFDESDRRAQFGLLNAQHQLVDSFRLYLHQVNFQVQITRLERNKLFYQLDSTPVVYEYALWQGEGASNDKAYTNNRRIFIGTSLLGLLLLIIYAWRRQAGSSIKKQQP